MLILLNQMIVLFFLMMVGFLLAKIQIITKDNVRLLSALVLNVANPAMILASGMTVNVQPGHCFYILLLAVCYFAALIGCAYLIPPLLRIPREKISAYRVMTIFSNIGFMGIPLISALYDAQAVLDLAIFNIVYNILIYTYGIAQIGGKENMSPKKILNLGVFSALLALVLALAPFTIPSTMVSCAQYLGNMTAPLSMIVIGSSFVELKLRDVFCDVRLVLFTCIKMLLIPALGLLLLRSLGMSDNLLGCFLVLLGAPAGSMTAMLADQYGGDRETTTKGVALTTLVSVITMSLLSFLLV